MYINLRILMREKSSLNNYILEFRGGKSLKLCFKKKKYTLASIVCILKELSLWLGFYVISL